MLLTFLLVLVGWTFFRAQSMQECVAWLGSMANPLSFGAVGRLPRPFGVAIGSTLVLVAVEWLNRRESFGFARQPGCRALRWTVYYAVVVAIAAGAPGSETFVYFQF